MSSNKSARNKLIELYGAECFIEKLHLRHDNTPRHYTSKLQRKKMKQLTYHHIKEKRNGGKTTIQNGALLSVENHEWFNRQPPQKQKELNDKFQEYKECRIVLVDSINTQFEIKAVKITPTQNKIVIESPNVYENMTQEEIEIYKEHKRKRNKRILKKFER